MSQDRSSRGRSSRDMLSRDSSSRVSLSRDGLSRSRSGRDGSSQVRSGRVHLGMEFDSGVGPTCLKYIFQIWPSFVYYRPFRIKKASVTI